ncbi:MAG: hypothetical protein ACLFV2_11655 [Desulfurivibrionaceae bacterium]
MKAGDRRYGTSMKRHKIILAFPILIISTIFNPIASANANGYRIENVRGNIYQFVDNMHCSVFLKTDNGILLTDAVFVSHELAKQDIQTTKADTVPPEVTFMNNMVTQYGYLFGG